MDVDFWRFTIVGGAAVGQTLFMLFFVFAPWWRGHVGRSLFIVNLTLCVLIDTVAYRVFFANDFNAKITLVTYGLVSIAIWYQFFTLCIERVKAAKRRRSKDEGN